MSSRNWPAIFSKLRPGEILGLLGSGLLLWATLLSRSSSGVVLGRYSTGLAVFAASLILIAAVWTGLLLRWKTTGPLARLAGKLPEFAAVMLAVIPIPLFLLLWFLFPFPLFERWNGFLGFCMLISAPGVFCLGRRASSEAPKGAVVTLITLAICLVLAELAVRAVVPGSFFNPRLGLVPHARYTIMVDLPGVSKGGTLSTNRWGLRGDEPPDDWAAHTTIVTVGGSTTANYYLDDRRTWSYVLQEELKRADSLVWVGNGGIPMHSAEHHDFFLREVVTAIQPDIVIFLTGANDIGQFMRGEVALHERPLPERGVREFMFRNSRLLQTLYKAKKVYVDRAPVISEAADPEFAMQPMTGSESPLPDDLREMLPDPEAYSRRIRRLIATSREIGVTPVFLTQPLLFEDSDFWRGIQGGSYWHGGPDSLFSAASYWRMLDFLNREVMEICKEEGILCFDLAAVIPHDMSMFYDSMHLTEAGAGLVGESVARFMLESGVLQR